MRSRYLLKISTLNSSQSRFIISTKRHSFFKKGICPNRSAPENGAYEGTVNTPWIEEQEARFVCNAGYSLDGERRSVCLISGIWSYGVPTCVSKYISE